jgi:small subunit ribosomal protein S17
MTEEIKTIKRSFEGEVIKKSQDKTISVLIKIRKMHQKYRKQYVETKKYAVHDENNVAKVGDIVNFQECRPYSKTKKWRLIKVVK